jgi:hypothetical protein
LLLPAFIAAAGESGKNSAGSGYLARADPIENGIRHFSIFRHPSEFS